MLFGLVRGAVVVAVFVLLAQFVELQQTSWWKNSRLLPFAVECAGWIQTFAETGMEVLESQAHLEHASRSLTVRG
jgi:membrane protein required for colicin V production